MTVLRIEIGLGNEAMRTHRDVAELLGKLVHQIEDNTLPFEPSEVGVLRDINGNVVGAWHLVEAT